MALMASVRRAQEPASSIRLPNVVAVAILLGGIAIGGLGWLLTENPLLPVAGVLTGLLLMPAPRIAGRK